MSMYKKHIQSPNTTINRHTCREWKLGVHASYGDTAVGMNLAIC